MRWDKVTGVGGIGTGIIFEMEGDATLTRNESRLALLTDARDYCKLHITLHYIARLNKGVQVFPIGLVGDDAAGNALIEKMRDAGMDLSFVEKTGKAPTMTSVCIQYPDKSGGNITSSNSACESVTPEFCLERARRVLGKSTLAVLVPEVPMASRIAMLRASKQAGAFASFSASCAELAEIKDSGILALPDLISVNEDEAAVLAGCDADDIEGTLRGCVEYLTTLNPNMMICVTLGSHGCFACQASQQLRLPPFKAGRVVNTGGAGDAFHAGVLTGLAYGLPFISSDGCCAVSLGNTMGVLSVASPHSIADEIDLELLRRVTGMEFENV